MKYCCGRFKDQVSFERTQGLNIRIVKLKGNNLLDFQSPYRFFITPGYQSSDRAVAAYNIAYCPFCGKDLFKFYKKDDYINENDTNFLYP